MASPKWSILWCAVIVLTIAVPLRVFLDHKLKFGWLAAAMILAYFATCSLAIRARRGAAIGRTEIGLAIFAWLALLLCSVLLAVKMPTS